MPFELLISIKNNKMKPSKIFSYVSLFFVLMPLLLKSQCAINPLTLLKTITPAQSDKVLTYQIKHSFTLWPDSPITAKTFAISYNHAFVREPIIACENFKVKPTGQPSTFEAFCTDTIDKDLPLNCFYGNKTKVDTLVRTVPLIGALYLDSACALACNSPAKSYTCIKVDSLGKPSVKGTIQSFGLTQAINNDLNTATSAFSWSGVDVRDYRKLMNGTLEWVPDFGSTSKGKAKSIRQKAGTSDPVVFKVHDYNTGMDTMGVLLKILMRFETEDDTITYNNYWRNDTVRIESDSASFEVYFPSPFTSKQGNIFLLVKNGVVIQSLKTGVFNTVPLPFPGTLVPFQFYMKSNITFHYNLDTTGLFGNDSCDVDLLMYGHNENCYTELTDTGTVLYGYNQPSCPGTPDGSINALPNFGTPPYAFVWSNGATTQTIAGLPAGAYTVIVTDILGVMKMRTIFLPPPVPITISGTVQNIKCRSAHDGSIMLNVSGGSPPYTYLWSNGKKTSTITGLYPGTFLVTVTDSKGCITAATYTITQPATSVTIAKTVSKINCGGKCNANIKLTVSGGVPPYTLLWNTGATTSALTGLCAGIYTCTITDAVGCIKVNTSTVIENPLMVVTVTAINSSEASATVTGGVLPHTFLWNTIPPQTTATATGLLPGKTYKVIVTDSVGCSKSKFITMPPARIGLNNIDEQVEIIPNPNDGDFEVVFNFDSEFNADISIYNEMGVLIFSTQNSNLKNSNELHFDNLAKGMYFIVIYNGVQLISKKVIVE